MFNIFKILDFISGYDRDGYDKEGFDKNGYNKSGYDRDSYDRYNYNRNGYDRNGYDRDGYDKEGFDKNGYNKEAVKRLNNTKASIILNEENDYLSEVLNALGKEQDNFKKFIPEKPDFSGVLEESQRIYEIEKSHKRVEIGRKIKDIESLKQQPYYGRMDIKEGDDVKKVYIGANSFNAGEYFISSVWSEVGRMFRAKKVKNFKTNSNIEYEVLRRRLIDIENSIIVKCYDEYSADDKLSQKGITDPFLLKILYEKRNNHQLTDIIRSIQLNQNEIIDYDFNKNLIVQGCAGSGKTMILLHRLANIIFNKKDINQKRIVIITPNDNFADYIEELSKFLKIDNIRKVTIEEYYIEIIRRFYEKAEVRQLSDDDIDDNLIAYIYSKEFTDECDKEVFSIKEKIETEKGKIETDIEIIKKEEQKKLNERLKKIPKYNDDLLNDAIDNIIKKKNFKLNHNTRYFLYAKILCYYNLYGAVHPRDIMINIDEGQDISCEEYALLRKLNPEAAINIYGDLNQLINKKTGITNWSNLPIESKFFELKENYRNSKQVNDFCNKELNFNILSISIDGVEVLKIRTEEFYKIFAEEKFNKRVLIIVKDKELASEIESKKQIREAVKRKEIQILTPKQAKGLEFDKVYVFDSGMTVNEKYISFTRSLNELIIIN